MSEAVKVLLCTLVELADTGSRGFSVAQAGQRLDGFVVRKGDHVAAYVNRCPHTGAPLDWKPHEFLDLSGGFIQCALHGALFNLDDGYCVSGPCAGDRLKAVRVRVEGEGVYLDEETLA